MMFEPEGDGKGSRNARAASDDGLGSGDTGGSGDMGGSGMGSDTESTSPPTNADQSSDLNGLEEWHIGLISFGTVFTLFCCMFTLMVSISISYNLSYATFVHLDILFLT